MFAVLPVLFFAAISAVSAETCADRNVQIFGALDVEAVSGTWWGIEEYKANNENFDCLRSIYTPINSTQTKIESRVKLFNGSVETFVGYATPNSADGWTGDLTVNDIYIGKGPQDILYTDYNNCLILYSCYVQDDGSILEVLLTLARQKSLSTELRAKVDAIYAENNLNGELYTFNQSDDYCPA